METTTVGHKQGMTETWLLFSGISGLLGGNVSKELALLLHTHVTLTATLWGSNYNTSKFANGKTRHREGGVSPSMPVLTDTKGDWTPGRLPRANTRSCAVLSNFYHTTRQKVAGAAGKTEIQVVKGFRSSKEAETCRGGAG